MAQATSKVRHQLKPPFGARCGNGPAPAVTGGAAVPQSDGCTGSEWVGPRHHRGTAVEHYAVIDVSLELSSVCMVDATGRIVREAKVASEPEALVDFFRRLGLPLTRVGLRGGAARDPAGEGGALGHDREDRPQVAAGPGSPGLTGRAQAPAGQAAGRGARHPRHPARV